MHCFLLLLLGSVCAVSATLLAGVAKVDGSLPIGVPLAGYSERHVKNFPIPQPTKYTFFMEPSVGIMDPTWVRAVAVDDEQGGRFVYVTIDAIGADGGLFAAGLKIAASQGMKTAPENVILCASHSHSGPGAVSSEKLWELAPATDLLVPAMQEQLASSIAAAIIGAEASMQPAKIALSQGQLPSGMTRNRRAGMSPYVTPTTVDMHLGVISIDDAVTGNPLATIFNFACHGTCYGPSNLHLSGDIVGKTTSDVEALVGGVALFMQSDAGDVSPTGLACENAPDFNGAHVFAAAVESIRDEASSKMSVDAKISIATSIVDFGKTNLNITLQRLDNCTKGGPLDICSLCMMIGCDANVHLDSSWVENSPRFTAIRIDVADESNVILTVPGEALTEVGGWLRQDAADLGFTTVFLSGYSNNHMGYFPSPREYEVGGYEGELCFWGIQTAVKVRQSVYGVASRIAPKL